MANIFIAMFFCSGSGLYLFPHLQNY